MNLYKPGITYHIGEQVHKRARAQQVNVLCSKHKDKSCFVEIKFETSLDRKEWNPGGGFILQGGQDLKGRKFTVVCFGYNSSQGMADEIRYIRGTITTNKSVELAIEIIPRENSDIDETLVLPEWLGA